MRHGLHLPNFGEFADVEALADVAAKAEAAGWDGVFLWDHIAPSFVPDQGLPTADVTVALTAMTLATRRIRLGPLVTPLARRRVQKVARETVSLDHLSGGRMVLGVGLGNPVDTEYQAFGEDPATLRRARLLDESLGVLSRLWSGDAVDFDGTHLHVHTPPFLPLPVQRPRIPIWVAATWPGGPGPLRRANRWDGVFPMAPDPTGRTPIMPTDVSALVERIEPGVGFEVVVIGGAGIEPADYAAAGTTWLLQVPWTMADALAARPPAA